MRRKQNKEKPVLSKKAIIVLIGLATLTACGSDSNNEPESSLPAPTPDTVAPIISLVGETTLNHEAATPYNDGGATASDNIDGDISASISINGNVDVNTIGSYTLSYEVSDAAGNSAATVNRIVTIVDTQAPTITLLGMQIENIEQGDTYTDSGAAASDALDGDISANIVVSGSVNTAVLGTYVLSYDVSDASGNAATSLSRTVVVEDTNPPMLVSVSPQDNATDITLDTTVIANFSEAIANSAISQNVLTLRDDNNNIVSGDLSIDTAGSSLHFQAQALLAENTQYTVSLSTEISDLAGNTLTNEQTWQFTTESLPLSEQSLPELINVPNSPVGRPSISVNDDGYAIAAWRQAGVLLANRYIPESGWQGVEEISRPSIDYPREEIQVAINDNGNIFTLWVNDDTRNLTTTVWARAYTANDGWGEVLSLDDRTGMSFQTQLAIDQLGNALAIWLFGGSDDVDQGIYVSRYDGSTNQWEDSLALVKTQDTSLAALASPEVAMNAAGEAIAVWTLGGKSISGALYSPNHAPNENGWSTISDIGLESESVGASSPKVAININRDAIVAWTQQTSLNSSGDIYANYYTTAEGWSSPMAVESLNEGEARFPQVAINEEYAVVLWTEYDGSTYSVYTNVLNDSKEFVGLSSLENNPYIAGNSNDGGARVVLDDTGLVTAVWEQGEFIDVNMRRENRIFINQFSITSTPSITDTKMLIQDIVPTEAYKPAFASDSSGTTIVVSQRLASNSLDIQAHIVEQATTSTNTLNLEDAK